VTESTGRVYVFLLFFAESPQGSGAAIPGGLPSVLTVGAMDNRGDPLEFRNWGEIY